MARAKQSPQAAAQPGSAVFEAATAPAEPLAIEPPAVPTTETAIAAVEAAASLAPPMPTSAPTDTSKGPIPMDQPTTPFTSPYAMDVDALNTMFGDLSERTRGAMEKSAKIVEDMTDFARGNVEAVMSSGRVAAKGAETIGQDFAAYSRKSFDGAAAAFRSFVAAKSPTELFRLQSDYARSAFDTAVAESSRLTETMLKLAGEIAQPLSSRVAVAAEKIKTPAL